MNKFVLRAVCAAAGLAAIGIPMGAHAESVLTTGAGALTAAARLDFRVIIPKVLFLQVGTGALMGNSGTVNLIDFTVPAGAAGNGTSIAATTGGDVSPGVVTARIRGNNGAITLVTSTTGALSNLAGDTLAFSQIGASAAAGATANLFSAPALTNGSTSALVPVTGGTITDRDALWTFSYLNAALVPPGTYGGTATNGRVTYTASML